MAVTLKQPIATVELLHSRIPLVHPFETSFGRQDEIDSIIVKMADEAGHIGYGETTVTKEPSYCYETIQTAWHIQHDFLLPFAREWQGDSLDIADLLHRWEKIRGHQFAKGGLEAAMLDLKAEQDGVSLGSIYGSTKTSIPTGVSIGIQQSIEELVTRVGHFIDLGYQRVKMKISPGWDVDVVSRIRKEYGDILLMVDANSAYSLSDKHIEILKGLDKFDLMMIEQPLAHDDILMHRELQSQMSTPICLDESIHGPRDAKVALDNDCCQIINIKPGRVGGFLNAIEIAKYGGKGRVWCGGMLEKGIGRIHNIFLQARSEFTMPGDTSGSDRYYAKDIINPPVTVDTKGMIQVPTGTGLCHEVDVQEIEKGKINSLQFSMT